MSDSTLQNPAGPDWEPFNGMEPRRIGGASNDPPTGAAPLPSGIDQKMLAVKLACDQAAPTGRTSAALRYYQSAERARLSGDEAECVRRLETATKALN